MKGLISLLIGLTIMLAINIVVEIIYGSRGKKGEFKVLVESLDPSKEQKESKSKLSSRIKRFDTKQYLLLFVPISIATFISALLFFRSFNSALIITVVSGIYPYFIIKSRKKKRKQLLNYQLREALTALSSSLKAGVSLNNALLRVYKDLERIHSNAKKRPIVDEFEIIAYELDLMMPVEDVLNNFKNRAELEDVTDFVNVTLMTRKKGGNLNEVIQRVSEIISDRIEIEHEINTLVAGKKIEAKILTVLPIVLVVMLSFLSPSYMSPMYNSILGRLLMIFASLLLVINYFVGKRIIDIEV